MNHELTTTDFALLDNGGRGLCSSKPTPRAPDPEWSWAVVEDMASRFTCSNSIAGDFAGQCAERINDLEFDLLCSRISLDFWEAQPETEHSVAEVLRDLDAEGQRHLRALVRLRERLLALSTSAAPNQHLKLPIEHCREQVRLRLFPKLTP